MIPEFDIRSIRRIPGLLCLIAAFLVAHPATEARAQSGSGSSDEVVVIDDFESYRVGGLPEKWSYLHERELVPISRRFMSADEEFTIAADGSNRVLRVTTRGEAMHMTLANGSDVLDWNLNKHPMLAWDWRLIDSPGNAREDDENLNDSAAAVYVVFEMDGLLFKRPRTIKYVYSAQLPIGTVVSYGKLKVVVVSSGMEEGNRWQQIRRNVAADHRMLFGSEPPARPLSIRVWGDSDNTGELAIAEFDNFRLLSE